MITISWHLLLLIIVIVIGFIYVYTLDDNNEFYESDRFLGGFVWLVFAIFLLVLYGGIFWW